MVTRMTSTAYVFPGQGSQSIGMGRDIYESSAAARALFCQADDEVPGRDPAWVPHFLPGKNPYLTEFATKHNIPVDATRGGAETMYPEFRAKLKTLPPPPPKKQPAPAAARSNE